MSKKLLETLNGNNNGAFRFWLDNLIPEPRIAWYPSAGEDFSDLLFLSQRYTDLNRGAQDDPPAPHIFLHTDYFPYKDSKFLDKRTFNIDERTKARIKTIEELPPCDLPLDGGIVCSRDGGPATGRVVFLEMEVDSPALGKFAAEVLYVFAENAAFCAKLALPTGAKFSHIVHVRHGGGCGGGGHASGAWLLNVLGKLGCEVFITDGKYHVQSGDLRVCEIYPALSGEMDATVLRQFRLIPSHKWSSHGDVSWNFVK